MNFSVQIKKKVFIAVNTSKFPRNLDPDNLISLFSSHHFLNSCREFSDDSSVKENSEGVSPGIMKNKSP